MMLKTILLACSFTLLASCSGGGSSGNDAAADQPPASPPATTLGKFWFSAATYSASPGASSVVVTVNRSDGSNGVANVDFKTRDGSAVGGTDYVANDGTLSWADGDSASKTIAISISNTSQASVAKTFSVVLTDAAGAALGTPATAAVTIGGKALSADKIEFDHHIVVDQFGYRPGDQKVAVIRNPQIGYDSAETFAPGSLYQLRRADDGTVVFAAALTPWNGGALQASSGDNGWWFDFSEVTTPGKYFVYDIANNARSAMFDIESRVYEKLLKTAMRTFFYQRSGFAKRTPYAEACWVDEAAYLGPNQDSQARDVTDKSNASKVRDLSGGWFDAGDTNKYVTFAATPVHQLLTAYQTVPAAFTDDFNIPESRNGIPDVIDELKWETDWLKKMQNSDGSAALKVGAVVHTSASPPSSDLTPHYYIPTCTSSTIALAGMLAHASHVYSKIPTLASEAADLRSRAISAWSKYQSTPVKQTNCDTGEVKAGIADWSVADQNAAAVVAGIYLFAITGDAAYHDYVKANYRTTRPYNGQGWTLYNAEQGEALLFYTTLPSADATLRSVLLEDKRKDISAGNRVYGFAPGDDLYRAFIHDPQYHWGGNQPRANYGNTNNDVLIYDLADANPQQYSTRAVEVLHYFHGVNPLGMVYLSNMQSQGATRSANEIFHLWYAAESIWSNARTSTCGPAPGYVTGGPNANAASDGVPALLTPPIGQPLQKSYKDWNVGYNPALGMNESSWAVTEPAIYYQAAYVKLLAMFVR
jgi:endoglucanase